MGGLGHVGYVELVLWPVCSTKFLSYLLRQQAQPHDEASYIQLECRCLRVVFLDDAGNDGR